VDVRVTEIDTFGAPVSGGLTATATINPDPTAPPPADNTVLNAENYTPAIFNPAIFNPAVFNAALLGGDPNVGIYSGDLYSTSSDPTQAALQQMALLNPAVFNPAIFNPAVFNPAVFNPAVFNPAVFNPAVFNPAVFNPAVFNPAVFNPAVFNPAVFNPAVFNPAVFNTSLVETSVVVENTGNTTAAYSLNLDLDNPPDGFLFQVMVYKTYQVPNVEGCDLTTTTAQEQLVNVLAPNVNGSLLDPNSTSFYIPPGDNVVVTVRIVPDPNNPVDPSTIASLPTLNLSQSIVPQSVDTVSVSNGETEPTPVTVLAPSVPVLFVNAVSLLNATVGNPYSQQLTTTGGNGSPVTWSLAPNSAPLPAGLTLNPASGFITGTPGIGTQGVYLFTARARDNDQTAQQAFSLEILPGGPIITSTVFTEAVIVDDFSVPNDGTLVVANDLGASPSAVQLANGLLFGTVQAGFIGPNTQNGGGDFSTLPFSPELDALLSDQRYITILSTASTTIGGLTPGANYRLQLLFANTLNLTGNQIQVTVEGASHVLNNWQDDAINLMVDFVASGTSVQIDVAPDPNYVPGSFPFDEPGRAVLNAYALHQVNYIFDQRQTTIDQAVGSLAIEGINSEQKLAQTATAGLTGTIDEVRFPLSCSSGELTVEIQGVNATGVPNGVAMAQETFTAAQLPSFVGTPFGDNVVFMRPLRFSNPASVVGGQKYAIVLQSSGSCGVFQGPLGDSYAGGTQYFDARPNLPGWVEIVGGRLDLPFMTKITAGPPPVTLTWRADFDMSTSQTASGPYVCVRNQYQYNVQPPNASMLVDVYDEENGPSIGQEGYSIGGNNNLGDEILLSGSALADGIGFMLLNFSDPTTLNSLTVEGRSGLCIGGGASGTFNTALTPVNILLNN
ncbi:MAG: Ig domain-containing protein, partial [Woeseia sp.]